MSAINHYMDYLVADCERMDFKQIRRNIEILRTQTMKPKGMRAQKARKATDNELKEFVAEQLSSLPAISEFKKAVHEATIHKPACSRLSSLSNSSIDPSRFSNSNGSSSSRSSKI